MNLNKTREEVFAEDKIQLRRGYLEISWDSVEDTGIMIREQKLVNSQCKGIGERERDGGGKAINEFMEKYRA